MRNICKEYILQLYSIGDSDSISAIIKWILSEMPLYHITNPFRIASYLAHVGCISNYFRDMEERVSCEAYEGRKDLGNIQKGDGKLFKGRGLIYIKGRNNYKKCGEAFGIDFINYPELLCQPEWAVKSSLWYWDINNLNAYADKDDLKGQMGIINGGYNGYEDRKRLYINALKTLIA